MLALATISFQANATRCGMPWPPYAGSHDSAGQPASTNCLYASLNPGGVVTEPSSLRLQPCSSPTLFNGASTPSQNFAPSSKICSTVSNDASAKLGKLE